MQSKSTIRDGRETKLQTLKYTPLKRSVAAITVASAFLFTSAGAFAQTNISSDYTGDISDSTVNLNATSTLTVTGSITGTGTFADNVLNLNTQEAAAGSSNYYSFADHIITNTISNFGTVNLNYSVPVPGYDWSGKGFADWSGAVLDPYSVTVGTLDTGTVGQTVKLNVLTPEEDAINHTQVSLMTVRFDGDISGAGGLEVNLPTGYPDNDNYMVNTLILAGQNTYTGLTTVKEGVLRIGSGTSFSFGADNDVQIGKANAKLIFDIDATAAGLNGGTGVFKYNGRIFGVETSLETFVKAGTGTLVLTQDQTYTGQTVVTGGTLQLGDGLPTTSGSVAGMINVTGDPDIAYTDAHLVIDRHDDITLQHVNVSGYCPSTGCTLTKLGTNTVTILAGGLAGTTTVNAGTLRLGDGSTTSGASVSGILDIVGGARFVYDINNPTLANGPSNLTGSGEFVQESGNLILGGNNTSFTGALTINAGTLQFGGLTNGAGTGTGSLASTATVTVADGATLAFNRTDAYTADFTINGAGNLRHAGTGNLTLSGGNVDYTGETIVTRGRLILDVNATNFASSALRLEGAASTEFVDNTSGGYHWNQITVTGTNTNTYTGNLNAAGSKLDFILSNTMGAGSTLLDVSGTANINGSQVSVVIAGNSSPLGMGDSVKLIHAASLVGAPANAASLGYAASGIAGATGTQGSLIAYAFDIVKNGNDLGAIVSGARIREEAKSLSEGHLSGTAALVRSGDFIASHGIAAARAQLAKSYGADDDGKQIPEKGLWGSGLQPFYAHSAGRLRHNTGSHVNTQGYNFIAGAVAGFRSSAGDAMAGAFFEYGKGEYDTYNSFTSGQVTGDGNTHHRGAGFFGRIDVKDGYYVEGSVRRGQVDTKYQSDYLRDAFGTRAAYTSKTAYTGAHLGAGKLWPLKGISEKLSLDTYGQALWTRQDGDTVTLSTGERVSFSRVSSERLKAGARVRYDFSDRSAAYAGIAYDHEFAGKAKAKLTDFNGAEIPVPKMTGGTGIVELGFLVTPSASSPVAVDLGIQGYAGKREGVTGNLRLNYFF
jgi:autotransporter-associated beta strand protein